MIENDSMYQFNKELNLIMDTYENCKIAIDNNRIKNKRKKARMADHKLNKRYWKRKFDKRKNKILLKKWNKRYLITVCK